jgi:hypothetical protein
MVIIVGRRVDPGIDKSNDRQVCEEMELNSISLMLFQAVARLISSSETELGYS